MGSLWKTPAPRATGSGQRLKSLITPPWVQPHDVKWRGTQLIAQPRLARVTQYPAQAAALHVVDLARRCSAGRDRFLRRQHHAIGAGAVARIDRWGHRLLGAQRLDTRGGLRPGRI